MENASKALIIAGAILLAIVIISLGLVVVNNTRGVADNSNLSEQEIQSFNAKFTAYEGENITGSRVNSLIQQVMATNQSSYENGDNHFITIAFNSITYTGGSYAVIAFKDNGDKVYKIVGTTAGLASVIAGDDSGMYAVSVKKLGEDYDATHKSPSLSVNTGKSTYKVKLYYNKKVNGNVVDNALVKCIVVE